MAEEILDKTGERVSEETAAAEAAAEEERGAETGMEIATEAQPARSSGGVFSLEGVLMIAIAVLFDIVGIILVIIYIGGATIPFAEIISWISDVLGLLFFGAWMAARWLWFKSRGEPGGALPSEMPKTDEMTKQRKKVAGEISARGKQAASEAEKIAKSGAKAGTKAVRFGRLGLAFLGEIIPILGALPLWTFLVYSEMKKNGPMLL